MFLRHDEIVVVYSFYSTSKLYDSIDCCATPLLRGYGEYDSGLDSVHRLKEFQV